MQSKIKEIMVLGAATLLIVAAVIITPTNSIKQDEEIAETSPTEVIYVIGNHVFTDETDYLTAKMIMLASRTIEVPGGTGNEEVLNNMAIYLRDLEGNWIDATTGTPIDVANIEFDIKYKDLKDYKSTQITTKSLDKIKNAIQNDNINTINLSNDITLMAGTNSTDYEQLTFTKDKTLNLGDHTITLEESVKPNQDFGVVVNNGANLVINANEDGGINTTSDKIGYSVSVVVRKEGGTVTINGGTYISKDNAIYLYNIGTGKVIINDGFFASTTTNLNDMKDLINAPVNSGTPLSQPDCNWIVIKGGTFVNYDPSLSGSIHQNNDNCNYVAEGYKVIAEEQQNGDIWYTVVPE